MKTAGILKKDLKMVCDIYPELVQLQVEDYCPTSYRIVVINSNILVEEDIEEEDDDD